MGTPGAQLPSQEWLDLLPDATIICDETGLIFWLNKAASRLFGFRSDELIHQPVEVLIPEYLRGENKDQLRKFLTAPDEHPMGAGMDFHARRRDGSSFPVEIMLTRLKVDVRSWVFASIRDVSEQKRAKAALQEREQRLRTIFDAHQDLQSLIRVEPDGRFVSEAFNQATIDYAREFTPDPNAFLERDRVEYLRALGIDESEIERSAAGWRKVATGKTPMSREIDMTVAGGRKREILEMTIVPILSREGACTHLLWTGHLITRRARTEEELRKRERELEEAQSIAHIGSSVWNIPEDQIIWSDEVYRILGYAPQQFPAPQLPEFLKMVHPEDRGLVEHSVWAAYNAREPHDFEHRIVRPDGTIRYVRTRSHIQFDAAGQPLRMVATIHDVTELRENQRRLEEAQHMARLGSWYSSDGTSDRMEWSPELYRIYELDPSVSPTLDAVMSRVHPEDEPNLREKHYQLLRETGHFEAEDRLLMPDGRVKHIFIQGSVTQGPDGRPRIGGTVQDITERKLAEQEREKLQAQLAQAQKMESIGRLAGGVAHDFNNMLTVILGYTALAEPLLTPGTALQKYMTEIIKAATRSKEITQKLLGFSRRQIIAPVPSNLNDLVSDLLEPLARLIGEDIEIQFHPGKDLWMVVVDPSQINQILLNLAVNARDAMAHGGKITVETDNVTLSHQYSRYHPDVIEGPYVLLAVSDTGTGMNEETLNHIFEPFFTTKGGERGTGLGLATVYGILKQNGGFVNVYSERDHGTTFKIYLPSTAGQAEAARVGEEPQAARPAHGTILLVEDDPLVRDMTNAALQSIGYTVLEAATPGEAIRLCASRGSDIQLMLTDVVMPGMNGMELREQIRALIPEIKVLFMSGYTSNVVVSHGVLKTGVHFIQKPFTLDHLEKRLADVLASD